MALGMCSGPAGAAWTHTGVGRVVSRPLHKVVSRVGRFGEPTDLFARLVGNLERLIEEPAFHQLAVGRVAVWVAYKDGRAVDGQAMRMAPSDRFDVLLQALRPCLRAGLATRMHLFAESLAPDGPSAKVQRSRFDGRGTGGGTWRG